MFHDTSNIPPCILSILPIEDSEEFMDGEVYQTYEVKARSTASGEVNTRNIQATKGQMLAWGAGDDLIQNIFRKCSADDREFLMSGITPEEWEDMFGGEE